MTLSICIYFPKEPEKLFQFLGSATKHPDSKTFELLLFVDNDDHKVSSEFYDLRKFIRKGLNVQVFVNPSLGSSDKVFEFLSEKSTGDGIVVNNGFYTDIVELIDRGADPIVINNVFKTETLDMITGVSREPPRKIVIG